MYFRALLLISSICLFAGQLLAEPSFRGFQVALSINESEIEELADEWGVNLVRVQIGNNDEMDGTTGDDYLDMMDVVFERLDDLLPVFAANNIQVVIALYSPPGGFETRTAPAHYAMFSDVDLQDEFLNIWEDIIDRYGDNDAVHAFDILNEPAIRDSLLCAECMDWNGLLVETISVIRDLNPTVPLIIKSLYGDPSKLTKLPAINDSNVIYSYHAYPYLRYQHAGIEDIPNDVNRPTKAQITNKLMKHLGKFLQKAKKRFDDGEIPAYPPRINVGEFAMSACATNGPAQFLADLIGLLEADEAPFNLGAENRKARRKCKRIRARGVSCRPKVPSWKRFANEAVHESWTSHSFAEAQIWDPRYECSGDTLSYAGDTDRGYVLETFFGRN